MGMTFAEKLLAAKSGKDDVKAETSSTCSRTG